MPQMAPLWWTSLFMMFILSYSMINMMMYFNMSHTTKKIKMKFINMNWKW
uniref:ATP synthase F0 subunit 8 n=1 Tax=Phymatostetha huangshanensis (nomen nudum) TaxID=2291524 RepID=A0A345UDH3_9HEMI|nr:ATP synthase F0 subunit 8 [Phymatostetha huangshanensis (nomen nudum)]AXI98509.1 ATP synthase F0 subunit 8 [Phymatostetha huangshanensis (nomen nudum)]